MGKEKSTDVLVIEVPTKGSEREWREKRAARGAKQDHMKEVMVVPRNRAMYVAEKLGARFDVGVNITNAQLEEVGLEVTGLNGEEVPDEEVTTMRGYLMGLFDSWEAKKQRALKS